MNYLRRIAIRLLLCMTFLLHHHVAVGIYYFSHIDVRDGLSENTVKCITQDSWGFMWFGTKNGLNRYDGINIKQYEVDDHIKGFGNHNVSALYFDANGLLWVGTDKGVFTFDPRMERFSYFDQKTDQGVGIHNWISQIMGDLDGNIWMVSPNEGAFRLDKERRSLQCFRTAPKEKDYRLNPQCICVRQNGDIWLGTAGGGIWQVDRKTGRMTQYIDDARGNTVRGKNIYVLCDYGDYLAIGEHEHNLMKFDTRTHEFSPVRATQVNGKVIRSIVYYSGELVVGTQNGLYVINEAEGTEEHINENPLIPNWLSDTMIYSLYVDRTGGVWVGTMRSGANYVPIDDVHMTCYLPTGMPGAVGGKWIRDMLTAPDGQVWVATEEGRLCVFNPSAQQFRDVPVTRYEGGTNRLGLMVMGDDIWSGIFKNGLDVINRHAFTSRHYTPQQLGLEEEGTVFTMVCDDSGKVWLGTGRGVYRQKTGMFFEKATQIPDVYVIDMQQDRKGNLWIATIGNGLYRYDLSTAQVECFEHKADDPNSLSSNDVSGVLVGRDGNLWLATDRGGLCHYDVATKRFSTYSKAEGLPDDVTYKMLEDDYHNLWFGTNHGIVCFNTDTKQVEVFNNHNLMPGNQFNYKSATKTQMGTLLFGGSDGIVSINPSLSQNRPKDTPIYISDIRVDNREVTPGDGMIDTNSLLASEIRLPHDFSSISINVTSLDYSGVAGYTYEYMLEGVDKGWIVSNDVENIAYTRLQPGSYLFKIRYAGNADSQHELLIVVRHPWWLSLPARLLYVALVLALIWWLYRSEMRRQARRQTRREQEFLEAKDKELLESKINFFTYITHEIRTPLTLINGSVENIEAREQRQTDALLDKNLKSISKNSRRLLNLINQLLDFRKMDRDSTKLSMVKTDMVKMVSDIIDRFEPSAEASGKHLTLETDEEHVQVPLDQEAVTKILSNLLTNAIKYSQSFIKVRLSHNDSHAVLTITNDGDKIPVSKAEEIFQPFSRLDHTGNIPGTGLGLPLARSLAEAHHGSLRLNIEAANNEFMLTLPLHQENVIEVDSPAVAPQPVEESPVVGIDDVDILSLPKRKEYVVLVVEDNEEVRAMIVDHLSEVYEVKTAANGREGLDLVKASHVDLVISDVMMPVMDGVEMCRLLKEDIEVNHIPVIMLTAKQTLQSQLEGLKAGADAYIAKPFSFAHLLTQIENLLANRKRERESFLHKPYLPVQGANVNKVEEEFLDKASQLIIANIKDSTFNVERLAQEMFMSRSSLHRKIKEVSDLSPVDFIRLIKLKKAAELIREEGYRTTEVCEMVGINSPSYFIKIFQKQFGMTPKEFASSAKR